MATPDSNCPECHGDPRGFLGLTGYTPCKSCNELPMSGFEKDRATYDLANVLEAMANRPVVVPDDDVPSSKIQWDAWNDSELKS